MDKIENIMFSLGAVAVVGCFLFLIVAFCDAVFGISCHAYGEKSGRNVDYGVFQGCMVEHDGKWYSKSELKYILGSGNE